MTRAALFLSAAALALAGCATDATNEELTDTTPDANLPRAAGGQSASLLSAFFGLDNALPRRANRICQGAEGKDGMPVIFSTEIDHRTMQAGDFQVVTESGKTGVMHCVSLLPATDAGELRTVLLVGEFGDARTDPPARVTVSGHLTSIDGKLDFKGASVTVTPLAPGPSLVMAEIVSPEAVDQKIGLRRTKGSTCPTKSVAQAVRVVWAGGVRNAKGDEAGEAERSLYRVTLRGSDGALREIKPIALGDLGDGDNNHVLCLDSADHPVSVAFPAGHLIDPNDDLNPDTSVPVGPE